MLQSRKSRALGAIAIIAVSTGCVSQSRPGVAIKALQSDIAFGFRVNRPAVIPPTADFMPEDTSLANQTPAELPTVPRRSRPFVTVPPPPTVPCPPAAEGAFPAQAATFGVSAPPRPGRYRWKETVVEPLGNGQNAKTVSFVEHDITNVSPVTVTPNLPPPVSGNLTGSPTAPVRTFTYDEVIHNLDGSTTTTTYQVKENQVQFNNTAQVGTDIQEGPPDRGLSLLKVVQHSADGKTISAFAPESPVLLLPLDVVSPLQFQSTGVGADGSSLTVNGNIVGRARVDACGTIVDGWEVQSQQVFSSTTPGDQPVPVDDTYYVGTQIGGLLTFESKTLPSQLASSTTPTIIDSIAQLTPDPLPAGP